MSKIRSKNTVIEKKFFRLLKGLPYKKHYKRIPGCPDAVFLKQKVAIFIDGDFWHGYNFKKTKKRLPKKYWQAKIAKNIKRDREVNKELKKLGWKVIRIWEHEIKKSSEKIKKVLSNKEYGNL